MIQPIKIRTPHLLAAAFSIALATPAFAQDAKALRAQANAETNQEKQVQLLCKAADLEPKNKDFRKDCEVSKGALINSDKQSLKTALDAADANQIPKAKRYAKYVSSLDPETHRQAEQLLARLNGPGDAPAAPAAPAKPADNSAALLAQANTAFEGGNFGAAKSAAQGVTDSNLKPLAGRIISDIDRYNGLVSTGRSQEGSGNFAAAEQSYKSALDISSHVGGDDLNGKIQHVHQQAVAAAAPPPAAAPQAPVQVAKNNIPAPPPTPTKVDPKAPKPPEPSPDEKKRKFLDEANLFLSRKDNERAVHSFNEVLKIDPNNAEAKNQIAAINAQIAAELSRDPAKLEKTLREAITAFYSAHYEDAESSLNRYLGADIGKKKGAAYFYLGATESTLAFLDSATKRTKRQKDAQEDFKQARSAGYQPIEKYVSPRILEVWKNPGM